MTYKEKLNKMRDEMLSIASKQKKMIMGQQPTFEDDIDSANFAVLKHNYAMGLEALAKEQYGYEDKREYDAACNRIIYGWYPPNWVLDPEISASDSQHPDGGDPLRGAEIS